MPPSPSGTSARFGPLGLCALLWIQIHWVADTNFGGFDEWMVLDLNAHGIVSVPYANRPLGLVWSLPASALWARGLGLWPFALLHGLYLCAAALLLRALCRRLAPSIENLATLVPVFFVVWAPGDLARLSTIERALYAGITCGALACLVAFVESWFRRSVPLLAAACAMAFLMGRSYEGALALLAGAPLLLAGERGRRGFGLWVAGWEAAIAASLAFAVRFVLAASTEPAYQLAVLKPERDPLLWLERMGQQYAYHLVPLVSSPPAELAVPAVGAACVVFFLVWAVTLRRAPALGAEPRRFLRRSGLLGLLFAGLGYSLVVLGTGAPTAFRLQFLSGPGIALALAVAIVYGASFVRADLQRAVVGGLAAWVVAVGTGRTVAMQRIWDAGSLYGPQTRELAGLISAAPEVKAHTLLVMTDEAGAWRATFGFRHAVQRLYGGRAEGFVPGVWDALYPVRFASDGVYFEPWPAVRQAWRCGPSRYDYAELVVLHASAAGAVAIAESWPASLPPLPAGARYAPRPRLEADAPGARRGP